MIWRRPVSWRDIGAFALASTFWVFLLAHLPF